MKTIVYDYLFNYFGKQKFKGEIITGGSINIAIRVYMNSKEVKFEKDVELSTHGNSLFDVFDVSVDRETVFKIKRNLYVDNLFRLVYGFDKIEADVIGYSLDVYEGLAKDLLSVDLPKDFENFPVSKPIEVSKDVFTQFILNNIDDFDIPDNHKAQCGGAEYE